jgi:prepilin-type N-terminal cleavage/methylation domain-containing protein
MRNSGFTLAEVMIAAAIAAIIIAAGIAPLVYVSRMISSAREDFSMNNKERSAVNRILRDVREALNIHSEVTVRIVKADDASPGDNGFLIVWTAAGAYTTRPVGSVAWGIPGESVMMREHARGLYRWTVSGDIQPGSVNPSALDPGDALLVLPGVKSVVFAALNGSEWKEDFSGARPKALRVTLGYDKGNVSYEEMLPSF